MALTRTTPGAPGPGTSVGSLSSSQDVDLSDHIGKEVYLQALTQSVHVRFGATAPTATTTDLQIAAGSHIVVRITRNRAFLAAIEAAASGTLVWAVAGD